MNTTKPAPSGGRDKAIRLPDLKRKMLAAARSRATKSGLPFGITVDDLHIPDRCPVLGTPFVLGGVAATDASPSLDKIVPALGYVPGNVLVVSNRVNRAKSNLSVHELKIIALFYENLITSGGFLNSARKGNPDGT